MDEDNSSKWRLTVQELKECKGIENISDEEEERVIDTLVQLSILSYDIEGKNHIDPPILSSR